MGKYDDQSLYQKWSRRLQQEDKQEILDVTLLKIKLWVHRNLELIQEFLTTQISPLVMLQHLSCPLELKRYQEELVRKKMVHLVQD